MQEGCWFGLFLYEVVKVTYAVGTISLVRVGLRTVRLRGGGMAILSISRGALLISSLMLNDAMVSVLGCLELDGLGAYCLAVLIDAALVPASADYWGAGAMSLKWILFWFEL
ncbi:hypothetical protein Nepgr_006784 [Nepenthes gracilis]|uniref:Uncharacterized protein n=1 Tax=Nepenthes gracilis TaxID=150966 RepID=A0AAD3S601_NEPGR|nr:hypothetical protein Nepgr_006784 [Nepenthes gracilis]